MAAFPVPQPAFLAVEELKLRIDLRTSRGSSTGAVVAITGFSWS